uniref:Uncharacterized protein n=1 Tax=Sus scrofa TaxID=9823 RepID=A0A480GRI5_PIG
MAVRGLQTLKTFQREDGQRMAEAGRPRCAENYACGPRVPLGLVPSEPLALRAPPASSAPSPWGLGSPRQLHHGAASGPIPASQGSASCVTPSLRPA